MLQIRSFNGCGGESAMKYHTAVAIRSSPNVLTAINPPAVAAVLLFGVRFFQRLGPFPNLRNTLSGNCK